MHKFPIGIDDYKKLIEEQYIHIDKTSLIEQWWEGGPQVVVVTRPRRFGKTVSLSMIKYFFENAKESCRHIFENTKIWQRLEFREIQGTYSVIFLSFKEIKSSSLERAYKEILDLLAEEVDRVITPIVSVLGKYDLTFYEKMLSRTADRTELTASVKWMTKILSQHYKKNVIVLIDEYDTPITYAYLHGYYDDLVGFIRDMFSKGLKGNPYLHKGFLTGVVRTAKDGILSGLNNPHVCTMLNWEFSDQFGFTQGEVDYLLDLVGRKNKKEEAKEWYNGYVMGIKYAADPELSHLSSHVYNPWSILQYLQSNGSAEAYWVKTGNTELLERLILQANAQTREELTLLLQGKALEKKRIDTDVIFPGLHKLETEPWSFLFFAGYITATGHLFEENKHWYTLAIPNKEIAELYNTLVLYTLQKTDTSDKLQELLRALATGQCEVFAAVLQEFILQLCSYYDFPSSHAENSLHLFVLGLLASFSGRYIIKSNLESGFGRYDIVMIPKKEEGPAILIEFKQGKEKELESLAQEALKQIEKSLYHQQIQDFGHKGDILAYGIAICGKRVIAKMQLL